VRFFRRFNGAESMKLQWLQKRILGLVVHGEKSSLPASAKVRTTTMCYLCIGVAYCAFLFACCCACAVDD
jgi:hypothetical protein